jgi:copper homeostasis protein
MPNRLILEICVESIDYAVAAERGGADRIELCADLFTGGITPSAELMKMVRRHLQIPIHVLIRPRAGDFLYSHDELQTMRADIRAAKHFGMDGIVLGILQKDNRVDVECTKAMVELSSPLPVTFHRAFDESEKLEESLEDVIQTGASRILTSAGQARATDGLSTLTRLVHTARERIIIMPCGGINSDNVAQVVRTTAAREIHSSAGTSKRGLPPNGAGLSYLSSENNGSLSVAMFEQKVAALSNMLEGVANGKQ